MKLPIIQYHVTVNGSPVATFAHETGAAKVSGQLADLITAAGGTTSGPVGYSPVKSVVDTDLDGVPGTLDTAAMAEAFHDAEVAREQQKAEAEKLETDDAVEATPLEDKVP